MKSAIDKGLAIAAMSNWDKGAKQTINALYAESNRLQAAFLVALIELQEVIDDGLMRIDQTHVEGAMMLVGCKESFDEFLKTRIRSDKVISEVLERVEPQGHPSESQLEAEAILRKPKAQENQSASQIEARASLRNLQESDKTEEKTDSDLDEEKKTPVTFDRGNFGLIPSDSGIA